MLRYLILPMLIFTTAIFVACGGSADTQEDSNLPDRIEMFFIYEENCASCDGTEEFFALVNQHISNTSYPYVIETINIYHTGGDGRFSELSQYLLGVDSGTLTLPVLIINGLAFQGMNNIRDNFNEAFLTAGHDLFTRGVVFNPRYMRTGPELFADFYANPDNITLVYFYRIVCPACQEVEPLLENLPREVSVDGRYVTVDLVRINTRSGNNRERVLAFFDAYNVPNEYRFVPIIFTATGFYTGPERIAQLLEDYIREISNIGFKFP